MTGSGDGHSPAQARIRAQQGTHPLTRTKGKALVMLCIASLAGGCSSSERAPRLKNSLAPKVSPTLGVSASPRVHATRTSRRRGAGRQFGSLPKGGGYRKIGSRYKIGGRWYTPHEDPTYDRIGIASWYGSDFHARLTANGETYDMNALTAAHKTLPLPSYAYVTNQTNGRTILVRINDRGPYAGNRIIDLSRATARALGMERAGVGKVRVQYAGPAPLDGNDHHERKFLAAQRWNQPHSVALAGVRQQQSRRRTPYRDQRSVVRTRQANAQGSNTRQAWDPYRYRQSLGR